MQRDEDRLDEPLDPEQAPEEAGDPDVETVTPEESETQAAPSEEPEVAAEAPREAPDEVAFFLSLAGRFPLLDADRERELAVAIWSARRRLATAIDKARRSRGDKPIQLPPETAYPMHRISPAARRRLIATEEYAERLLRLIEEGPEEYEGERFDRSLSVPPAMEPAPSRRRRSRSSVTPLLNRNQVSSIAPILREELKKIRAAREELVEHNLRLVVWAAKAYRGRGLDLVDLIQEGSMGLLRAIDRFDPAVGTRFSTFATHWVRQGMRRALAEKARTIRIPINRLPEVREAMRLQSQLSEELDRAPTADEIAARMGVSREKVEELLPALAPIDSLDAPLAATDLRPLDLLADERTSPLESAIEEETVRSVQEVLERMPERDRMILAMRYGIGYPREHTLEEIGEKLGLSRERIRQIEKGAREELRSLLKV